jgi:UDP-N-acetylmuramoyl-tripeptide--D-alanyl-D-alanine ligase
MMTEELYRYFINSSGVTTDSRNDSPGRIFFALRGENFDGHLFVEKALEGGCINAVIDNPGFAIAGKTILVEDVLKSLQQLARYHRQQFTIPVLAITGSNGKTTTKELINLVLSGRYQTLATRGNLNNHIGVPLTLLEINSAHEIAVIEMGANHIGEIAALCDIAMPDHGLITNIGSAHLEGFGSPEGVLKGKSELFRYLKEHGGTVFLNNSQSNLRNLVIELEIKSVSFGKDEESDITGTLLNSAEALEMVADIRTTGEKIDLKTRLTGGYNFDNILSAVCAGTFFRVPVSHIKSAIENYQPANNRSQIFHTTSNKLLLDAYNANPDSMQAALKNFSLMPGKNKSVILGDMLELGRYAKYEHQKIVDILSTQEYDNVFLIGPLFYQTVTPTAYLRFLDIDELTAWLQSNPLRDGFVLLKGSRGIKLEKCIGAL